MYEIIFYHSRNGKSEIEDYLDKLLQESFNNKNSRIIRIKILSYMKVLSEYGTRIGIPFVKHIEDGIWELRPLNNRIFFFMWKDNQIILLSYFIKKTRKTPMREIERAKSNRADFIERCEDECKNKQ